MPKAFTEREREIIHRRLVEQGYKLFSSSGLKKTNVEELARAAGISKGAFYLFYDSKEDLFMDVVEEAEARLRREVFTAFDQSSGTPRARLYAILKKAFGMFKTIPLLKFFTSSDYDLLFRRISPQKLQEHLVGDKKFLEELVTRCRAAGIPVTASPNQIIGTLYLLVLAYLHEDDLGGGAFSDSFDTLLELVVAFLLGEVEIQLQAPGLTSRNVKRKN